MHNITTMPALESLQNETIIYAVAVCVVAILLALLSARLVLWKPGEDRSYITRRIWFFVILVVSALGFFLYNDLAVKPAIKNVAWQGMFSDTNWKCVGIIAAGYLMVSIILMFTFPHSKFGSMLGKWANKK